MIILGVDTGTKSIGIAVSDPTGTLARPLSVIHHVSRIVDAAEVAHVAHVQKVGMIIVGESFDEYGDPTFEGRQAKRFANVLRLQTSIPVIMWDEAFTTQEARIVRREMGVSRKKRSGHIDDMAAAVLLQTYLDSTHSTGFGNISK